MRLPIVTLILLLILDRGYSQNRNSILVDKRYFKVDTIIKQNNSRFCFWRGKADTTYKRIIIERISNHSDKIIFDDFVRDGNYDLFDMNDDGFLDFVTFYHDHDEIHFFNPSINRFVDTAIDMPQVVGEIPTPTAILYFSYYDAQYGAPYPYSILFKYNGRKPFFLYCIRYITKETYDVKENATSIQLYKYKNGDVNGEVFVKAINASNPAKFDYAKYWRENFKILLGYH